MQNIPEPKGVAFYNIESDETRYAKLEAQIQGYINSSDMGINASRDQDYGWRLAPEWVRAVRAFRRDSARMRDLIREGGGQKVTTTKILYAIYGDQVAAYNEQQESNSAPYEAAYLRAISEPENEPAPAAPAVATPAPLPEPTPADAQPEPEDIPLDVDDADLLPPEDDEEQPAPKAPVKPEVSKAPEGSDTTVKVDGDKVNAPKTDGKTSTAKPKKN
ncbi:MAG TPA: hypothetical protein VD907_06980 [Verrucomicrobiae bacterium]|nr:hypothetical protein [Verrucomicrobiae bacterium]